jgi:HlyD family secretion protein
LTAINLDEDLTIEESPWRGRIITLLIVGGIAAAIAFGAYYFYFRDTSATLTRSTEDIPVKRGTINQTLIISGKADAEFNSNLVFQSTGKVAAVNVKVGDAVKQGDVLASLESDDLANAVAQARANQQAAQLKLDDLLAGATAAELAAADQGLATAQAQLTKARNDFQDLIDGPTAAELAGAQQALSAAEAQLATAKSNRQKLNDAPSNADKAAAEAGVAAAEAALASAKNGATSAQNSVTSATAALKSAEAGYCQRDASPLFCTTQAAPISGGDSTIVSGKLSDGTGTPSTATLASAVIAANGSYLNAVNAADSANASVASAQESLNSANARLDAANDGPKADDVAAADAAVASAESGVTAAREKLTTLQNGPTDLVLSTARAAADAAFSALAAAQSKRDEAYRGADANTLDQARQAVRTAALAVDAAQIRLKNAQIIAPFDGVVGAVNAKAGELFSPAATTTGAAIVLLTPDRLTLRMDVGETDYANVKLGQGGVVLFDSIPGRPYPFRVTEIGLNPAVQQGVVTYQVEGTLSLAPDGPKPAPGMNARGQIVTDSKPNILVIPPRAIRKKGADQVVDVKRDAGVVEQVITTGASDNNQIEVLTGLNEGDVVVVASLTTAKGAPTPKAEPTLPGGVR